MIDVSLCTEIGISCIEVLESNMQDLLVASNITNDTIGCKLNHHKGQKDKSRSDCTRTLIP